MVGPLGTNGSSLGERGNRHVDSSFRLGLGAIMMENCTGEVQNSKHGAVVYEPI
jgi:hypothetical protein